MWETIETSGPLWLALLVISPVLGALATLWAGRSSNTVARQTAIAQASVTALLATILISLSGQVASGDTEATGPQGLQIPYWSWTVDAPASPPWSIEVALSLGMESVNRPLLLAVPWLAVASLILTSPQRPPLFYAGVLCVEALALIHFAAQDAVTCLGSAELLIGLCWWLTGWYGSSERRAAAQRYAAIAWLGQRLWWFALLALAMAAVWVQLELRSSPTAIEFGWSQLAVLLPRFVSRYISSFEYWAVTSSLIVMVFAAGLFIRSALVPCHGWLPLWIQEAPPALVILQTGGLGLMAGALYLHTLAPLWAVQPVPFSWGLYGGAITAIVGGFLALAQTDLRKFVTYAWLSRHGWGWMGISLATAADVRAGWLSLCGSAWEFTAVFCAVLLLESRYNTREIDAFGGLSRKCPRLAAVSCLVAWWAVVSPWLPWSQDMWAWQATLLGIAPGCWLMGIVGQLLVAWSTVWLLQRIYFGRLREPLPDPRFFTASSPQPETPSWHAPPVLDVVIDDLTPLEIFAVLIPAGLNFVICSGVLEGIAR
ncbi:hypothetical protein GC163_07060 [bacterium]|nr:hypothetical protein [bacterium]